MFNLPPIIVAVQELILRRQEFPRGLRPAGVGRADHAPAGVSALRPAGDDLGAGARLMSADSLATDASIGYSPISPLGGYGD